MADPRYHARHSATRGRSRAILGPPGACLLDERESRCLPDVTGHIFRGSRPLGTDPKGSPVLRGSSPPLPASREWLSLASIRSFFSLMSNAGFFVCLFAWLHWVLAAALGISDLHFGMWNRVP